jgi:hypothetical protein
MPKLKEPKEPEVVERPLLYETVAVYLCVGETALTAEGARKLLGWTQPTEKEKPFKEYLFRDRNNVTTVCTNNLTNRPFYPWLALTYMYEMLAGNWRLNGETLVIGRTGMCLDCQHRLIALAWAEQEYANNPDKYPFWGGSPTIDCIIVFGVDESIEVSNTINVGKSRSLSDALYASKLFTGSPARVKQLCKVADYAVRLLCQRTGADENSFTPKRSHAESLNFLSRHPLLLKVIEEVYDVDAKHNRALQQYLSLGYLSALAYLMRCSSDGKAYHESDLPSESELEFKHTPTNKAFLLELATRNESVAGLREAIGDLFEKGGGSLPERIGLLVIGWTYYLKHKRKIPLDAIALQYVDTGEGPQLVSRPSLGGIDLGPS